MLTDGDVIRHVAPDARRMLLEQLGGAASTGGLEVMLSGQSVADVMTHPVVTVTSGTTIAEAIRTLEHALHLDRLCIRDIASDNED